MIRKNGGFALLNIATISLVLSAAGLWYMHRAHIKGELKGDLGAMVGDGKEIIAQKIPVPGQAQTPVTPAKIAELIKKHLTSSTTNNSIPQTVIPPMPAQGTFYAK